MGNFEKTQILDADWFVQSVTATETITDERVILLVDTTAGAVDINLGSNVKAIQIKDLGSASTNAITVYPYSGLTINGDVTEVIDADNGWVYYVLNGTDYQTVMNS